MSLLPKELVRKRYWSKKYPLCLKGLKQLNNKFTSSTSAMRLSTSLSRNLSNISSSSSASQLPSGKKNSIDLDDDELSPHANNSLPSDTLVLFARTDREKEEWFNLFKKSSSKKLLDSIHYLKQNKTKTSVKSTVNSSPPETTETNSLPSVLNNNGECVSNANATTAQTQTETSQLSLNSSLTFMNTFLIRLFADFFTHKQWIDSIQNKIQNKLSKIKLPSFIDNLTITGIDLGCIVPLIKQTSEPWCDEKGLWVHLEIDYSGGFTMSLATKLNLMKLRTKSSSNLHNLNTTLNSSFSFKNNRENTDEASISMVSKTQLANSSRLDEIDNNENNEMEHSSSSNHAGTKSSQEKIKKRKHLAIVDSNEEDSPESSGDEYVHTGYKNDEDNKLVETLVHIF